MPARRDRAVRPATSRQVSPHVSSCSDHADRDRKGPIEPRVPRIVDHAPAARAGWATISYGPRRVVAVSAKILGDYRAGTAARRVLLFIGAVLTRNARVAVSLLGPVPISTISTIRARWLFAFREATQLQRHSQGTVSGCDDPSPRSRHAHCPATDVFHASEALGRGRRPSPRRNGRSSLPGAKYAPLHWFSNFRKTGHPPDPLPPGRMPGPVGAQTAQPRNCSSGDL